MTEEEQSHPDRSTPARPVRVASFDGLGVAADTSARVAGFDVAELKHVGDATARPGRVAGFDALEGTSGNDTPVVSLDPARRRPPRKSGPRSADNPRPAGGDVRDDGARGDDVLDDRVLDDAIPPDRPLPRGRRRGGRVGRRGPTAPYPDGPDPEQPEPDADPVAMAREICLRLLTDRARTRHELAGALARKGVPVEAAAAVLDRFDEVGLIDDAAFAGQWVRSRHEHRGLGRRAIAVELRRKGVADDVAGEALAEVDVESEARRARELVDRKLRSLPVDTPERRAAAARRLVGMLARKGYGAGTAYRVVREALAEQGADVDELGQDL